MSSKPEKQNGESCSPPGNSKNVSSQIKKKPFHFVPPPDAPIFYPSEEEFQDPLAYIEKIRPIGENTGICKIKPPPHWQPPFAVDVDKLRFTPRVQRINELEAKTRIKLNFLDQIAKFWELQGSSLKIPIVEKRVLDLYTLHTIVQAEGGFDFITQEGRWSEISERIGYQAGKRVGLILKSHYERLLYPFDLFKQGKTTNIKVKTEKCHDIEKTETAENCSGASITKSDDNEDVFYENLEFQIKEGNRELKRLQFYGAGPKMPGFKNKKKNGQYEYDPLSKYVCQNCSSGESEEQMLLCDGCDDSYHTFCLIPPLSKIPKGDWRCPRCVAEEVSKPTEAFGFHQAQREYTLQQFGEMADQFKTEYFKMPGHTVPTDQVENEYWRIVSSIDEDVTVEYGADLHTMDHGSGFPTKSSKNLFPGDQEYAESNWNLNNLPVLEGSVLRYINTDVSGMTVPWMYVGMCFATFCWHNEDHWTYSINYMHWGDAKTWYGVPGGKAEFFEEKMKSAAPELFHHQPDLLHQLVTIMNPNILMNAGVPVYRIDQHAGEFIITFPRAYHAGFNQGYNFAEAVNFALPDWLRKGRDCVLHYSNLRRFCVFSHDELVCGMAQCPDELDLTIAAATYQDMLTMVDTEKRLRKTLLDCGITKAERKGFEHLPDDERQCEICKTTCFLSAVTCKCSTDILVCLRHYKALCECPPQNKTLKYRYTLDEITVMLKALKLKAQSFDPWVDRVKKALDPKTSKSFSLQELEGLLLEANDKQFPQGDLLKTLTSAVEDAKKCARVIHQLDLKKRVNTDTKYKLTIEELTLFCEEVDNLVCTLEEARSVKELLKETTDFEKKSEELLALPLLECSFLELEKCNSLGNQLCVELPNLRPVSLRLRQHRWLRDLENYNDKFDAMDLESLKKFINDGLPLIPCPELEEKLTVLQELLSLSEDWEKQAQEALKSKGKNVLPIVDNLLKKASKISCLLPTESILIDAIKEARAWLKLVEKVNSSEYYPDFDTIQELVEKEQSLVLHLTEVDQMTECILAAIQWKDKTASVFLRKNLHSSLMKVLSPRISLDYEDNTTISLANVTEPEAVSKLFKDAENTEVSLMKQTSENNLAKSLDPNDNSSFCTCGKGLLGVMIQCDLCKDWFHSVCVSLSKTMTTKYKDYKFLCSHCQRTKRPKLDIILNLLMSLQKLHVRVPEGEALQYLTERAISWQERANLFLQRPELQTAKNQVSIVNLVHDEMEDSEQLGKNGIKINEELRKQLEELCFEGNLLEVSLDEQHVLWRIVQGYRDLQKEPILIDFDGNMNNAPYKKGCKRLSEEVSSNSLKVIRID